MNQHQTKDDLYRSILFRAADIYEVDYEDVERDIGQQFDPIVRFMSGALASELEQVYGHLNDVERRLQKRLTNVLLPEYFHLPQPAHALASIFPGSEPLVIDETVELVTESENEEKDNVAFSPIFPTRILPVETKLIVTQQEVFEIGARQKNRKSKGKSEQTEIKKFAIGFTASEAITNWQGVSLFFNLRGGQSQSAEKTLLFAALKKTNCRFHKIRMKSQPGMTATELNLEDYLNGNERLQENIRARYQQQFITFTNTDVPEVEPILTQDYLPKWFSKVGNSEETIQQIIGKIDFSEMKAMYWLEVELAKPVKVANLATRLDIRFNVVPIINRKLNGHEKGKHHYLRNNSIKWISLKPEGDFLAIRKVYEEKPPEYPEFIFKPFAEFKEERRPSFTLRYGGVGRWDDFNAWKRLAYVVKILQENYKFSELIEEAAASLSLEDVHHLLGKKISKTAQEEKPTRDIYVLLHAGIATGIRVRVEYWTCDGEEANNIPAKTILKCVSKHKSSLDSDKLEMITNSSDGTAPLNSTQQIGAMKSVLLSRGRIVTREDVKSFCTTFLTDRLDTVTLRDGVGTDPRFDFGMTRMLEVSLKPTRKAKELDWQGICAQLQVLLEQKSTSSIPIKVQMSN